MYLVRDHELHREDCRLRGESMGSKVFKVDPGTRVIVEIGTAGGFGIIVGRTILQLHSRHASGVWEESLLLKIPTDSAYNLYIIQ